MHPNFAFLHRNLSHLRNETFERRVDSDAAPASLRQRRAPARLLRRQLQHAEMPRMFAQQCSPEFTGIFFCQPGKFVNETFGSEAGVRMSYRPPPLHGNIHFRLLIFNRQVGNLVRKIVGAFDRRGVVALGHHRLEGRPRHDGLPD